MRPPAVGKLLDDPRLAPYELLVGREALKGVIAGVLDELRREPESDSAFDRIVHRVEEQAQRAARRALLPAINATGVLLHTNLGRAPIAADALRDAVAIAGGYSNIEYDLDAGGRGSRYERLRDALLEATGAPDSLVVNNCAAAILLILDTFARDREVIVARNELVEIGGGFRIPDVLARSGAMLVEVGTTNKVRAADVAAALSPRTALILRTHRSNFAMSGFVEHLDGAELHGIARRAGVPIVEDLGSGALLDLQSYGLPHERTVREALAEGADLVAFSGDKLLGGPQAGIMAGSAAAIARLRANPLLRALRIDKTTMALLSATLQLYRDEESRERIPFFAMLSAGVDELRARAQHICAHAPGARPVALSSLIGGGSLAHASVPSFGVRVDGDAAAIAAYLRAQFPPVVGRIEEGALLLDLRTVAPEQDGYIAKLLA